MLIILIAVMSTVSCKKKKDQTEVFNETLLFRNGNVFFQGKYKVQLKDSKKLYDFTDTAKYFYPSGKLFSISVYDQQGVQIFDQIFDENGSISSEIIVSTDSAISISYFNNGSIFSRTSMTRSEYLNEQENETAQERGEKTFYYKNQKPFAISTIQESVYTNSIFDTTGLLQVTFIVENGRLKIVKDK